MNEGWDAYIGAVHGGERTEKIACEWLKRMGNEDAVILPKTYAKNASEKMNHIDRGDIRVTLTMFDGTIKRIMGVKGRSIRFTCREDFPFQDGLIVCQKSVWDNAKPKPRGFISINKAETHAAIIWDSTRRAWKVKDFKDGRYNRGEIETNYVCPTHCVQFFDMREARHE